MRGSDWVQRRTRQLLPDTFYSLVNMLLKSNDRPIVPAYGVGVQGSERRADTVLQFGHLLIYPLLGEDVLSEQLHAGKV